MDEWDALKARLAAWDDLDDEGFKGPTPKALQEANDFVERLRRARCESYLVYPDGDGGVRFEKRLHGVAFVVNLESDGRAAYSLFVEGKLMFKERSEQAFSTPILNDFS